MNNRLRTLRSERNWSQADLAERLGVSRQSINTLEAGKSDPSLPLALKIAQLFGSPIETIFFPEGGTMFAGKSALNFPSLTSAPFFSRFTPRAVKVIKLAQKESRRLGHNFVGTEQILLGLIEEGTGLAAKILKSSGVNLKGVRVEVEKIIGRGNGIRTVGIPFVPRAKLLLDFAMESADELGHFYVDTENLLLGLLRVGEGVAVSVLEKLGVDLQNLQQQVLQEAPRGSYQVIASRNGEEINQSSQQASIEEFSGETPDDLTSSEISARFCGLLFAWIEPRQLGRVIGSRTAFHLPDGDVVVPRISFVSKDRLKRVPRTYPELVPDLIVEIKSAFDRLVPLQEKIQRFLDLGVKIGLLIDPDEQIVVIHRPHNEVVVLRDGDMLTLPELLPDWEIQVRQLWSPTFG